MSDTTIGIIGFALMSAWLISIMILGAGFIELVIFNNRIERNQILICCLISIIVFPITTYFLFFFKF